MSYESFEVVPAVDVQDGEVVQLVQGERGTGKRYGDPVEAAERWVEAGAKTLHLVDLDGAFEGERANAPAIEAIIDARDAQTSRGSEAPAATGEPVDVEIQYGGGIRSRADALDLLDRGVDRVILGTAAVEDPEIVADVSEEYPNGVMVSLDSKGGEVVVAGWTESTGLDPAEAASRYEDLGAGSILFTDVDVEGQKTGVRSDVVSRVVDGTSIPVVASGGVADIDDVVALADAGAAGVVVGTALYEGAFTLRDAQSAVE